MDRDRALVIRSAYSTGVDSMTLAREYGHSTSMISLVIRGVHAATAGLPDIARRKGPAVKPRPPCGTSRAYEWHRRHGEPIDQACRVASTAHKRVCAQRAKRRQRHEAMARKQAQEAIALGHPARFDVLYQAALCEALEDGDGKA